MTIKIINRIYICFAKINPSSGHRSIKKLKKRLFTTRYLRLINVLRLRKNRRRRFVFKARRRWRSFFYHRRRQTIYTRFYVKRKLKRFRLRTIKKTRRINRLAKLFLFFFYFKIVYDFNFFFFLLHRFSIYSFNFKSKRRRKRYFGRGRYVFEHMLMKTFVQKKDRNIILAIGRKKFLPSNYSPYPLKIAAFTGINKTSFYEKRRLTYTHNFNTLINLLKNFKKSNLFLKPSITNTDLFVKLNTNNRKYNLFVLPRMSKVNLPTKINITSRQITVLKQSRLRVYNFYYKKSRNYKITKFFLKLSNTPVLINWLINWEFKFINILLRSKFSRNYTQATKLILNGYVFINGSVNTNINYIVNQGDIIQIPVSTKWFLRDRQQTSFFNRFVKELDIYTKKNYLLGNRYFFKPRRTERSWLLENLRNFSKTPTYMEVDYSTLSIIILKKTTNYDEVLPIYTNTFKPLTARLYNWRYFY